MKLVMDFNELKDLCEEKRRNAVHLSQQLSKYLFEKDLINGLDAFDGRLVKVDGTHYVLDEKIYIRITSDGLLNIIDERTTPYMWTIELMIEEIKTEDFFEYNGKIYFVRNLFGREFDTVNTEVQILINELDKSIEKLKNLQPLEKWSYEYYSAHEDITHNSLEEMLQDIVKHKYI